MAIAYTVICSELRINGKHQVNITFWMLMLAYGIIKEYWRYLSQDSNQRLSEFEILSCTVKISIQIKVNSLTR
jgi:hypothetical protein